jgi:two-component system chemotaxis response regulator CheB
VKILIAEDDLTSAHLLHRTLLKAGHAVTVAHDGRQALLALQQACEARTPFDALLTDWMMPEIDGIELIRRARALPRPVPAIMMLTTLSSEQARTHALQAGADDYLAKPYEPRQVLLRLNDCLRRRDQPLPQPQRPGPDAGSATRGPASQPPCVGVAITASTGGPQAMIEVIRGLPVTDRAAFFLVVHGPAWMLETFAQRLQQETRMKVHLAADGQQAAPGEVYLARGDRHLCVQADLRLRLIDEPPENFVRPAADPLFRSVARAFGRYSVAVVMTGLGRDGALGSEHIAAVGGVVVVQDPATAVAASMPQSVIALGVARDITPLHSLPAAISRYIDTLALALRAATSSARGKG